MKIQFRRSKLITLIIYIVLIGYTIFCLYPIYFTFATSLQENADIFKIPPKYFFDITLNNYFRVLYVYDFPKYITNSLIASLTAVSVALLMGIPCAYTLARYNIPRSKDIAFTILSFRFLPAIAIGLPMYLFYVNVGLYDSLIGLILIYIVLCLPFAIWIMRGYFSTIPKEIEESGQIDGLTPMGVLIKITIPLLSFGIAATAMICMFLTWNEFLLALLLTGMNARTVPVQAMRFMGEITSDWGALCAAAVIIVLPIFIIGIILRKYLIKGLTFGALKG